MELMAEHWNGYVHGTNTGKLALNFSENGGSLSGFLRFMDDSFGLVVYEIEGENSQNGIVFRGKPALQREDLEQGEITIECKLTSEGNLSGRWSSEIGTGGTFVAYPFNGGSGNATDLSVPEQIFTKRIQLGFVQLYKEDIINTAEFIGKEFVGRKVVVTYQSHEKPERINYFNDFINTNDLCSLTYLKLFVSEPESRGINRSITIELRAYGLNELIVQGMTESWVLGRSQMTVSYLKRYEDNIRSAVHRFYPAVHLVLFLIVIIWMTTMSSLNEKIWLGLATFAALYGAPRVFMHFFPNAVVKMGEDKLGLFQRLLQKGGSWIAGFGLITATLLIERYAQKVAEGIEAFINTLFNIA